MAWPKRNTRKLVVDDKPLLWHYSGHCPWCSDAVITVGVAGQPYVLFIDPYPWNFEYKPANVVLAIRWAQNNGWTPEFGPTRAMSQLDNPSTFVWLEGNARHLICKKQSAVTDEI